VRIRKPSFALFSSATFLGLFSFFIHNGALAQACSSHLDLVNSTDAELSSAIPCDLMGAAYMHGLGFGIGSYHGSSDMGDLGYYLVLRLYLEMDGDESTENEGDSVAFLLLASQGISILSEEERDARYYAVQAFVLGSIWEMNDEKVSASRAAMADFLKLFLQESGFRDFHEVKCFVRSDIPTLPIYAIVSSNRYNSCLSEKT
jgi:hypothetical protein